MSEIVLTTVEWNRHNMSSHGAASELRACAALLDAGYHVYRSEAPQAPFDLVAYKDGELLRVEVKTVTRWADPGHNNAPAFCWPNNTEWDLLAVIANDHVFCFGSGTTREEARDVVRVYYGYRPLGAASIVRGAASAALRSGVAEGGTPQAPTSARGCGSFAGYGRHLDRGEDPDACESCADALRRRRARRRQPESRPRPKPVKRGISPYSGAPVVHYDHGGEIVACGWARASSGQTKWSADPRKTTCRKCRNTDAYLDAHRAADDCLEAGPE